MVVRQTSLGEFDDADVNRGFSKLSAKVRSKLVERALQVFGSVFAFAKLGRVQRKSHEVMQAELFCKLADGSLRTLCLPWSAVAARPRSAVDPPISGQVAVAIPSLDRKLAAVLSSSNRAST